MKLYYEKILVRANELCCEENCDPFHGIRSSQIRALLKALVEEINAQSDMADYLKEYVDRLEREGNT